MAEGNGSTQVPDPAQGGFMVSRRTLWQRLGFKQTRCNAFIDDEDPGFAPGYMLLETACMFDWKDRLRILVSGKVMVSQAMRTDVHVIARKTASTVSVLPPNFKPFAVQIDAPANDKATRLSSVWRSPWYVIGAAIAAARRRNRPAS